MRLARRSAWGRLAGTAVLGWSCESGHSAAQLQGLAMTFGEWRFQSSPQSATSVGDNRNNDRLDDLSLEAFDERQHLRKTGRLCHTRYYRHNQTERPGQAGYAPHLGFDYRHLLKHIDSPYFQTEKLVCLSKSYTLGDTNLVLVYRRPGFHRHIVAAAGNI